MYFMIKILFLINFIFPYCVTFNLDLNNFNDIPEGSWVARANGNWNNWGAGITLNDNNNDGIHTGTSCSFDNGDYQYIFVIILLYAFQLCLDSHIFVIYKYLI